MLVNGQHINANDLSLEQLKRINTSLEVFMFKQQIDPEKFEPSFRADPKQFRKLTNTIAGFRSDVMGYFKKEYDNRYNLVNRYVVKLDEYDDYLYPDQWEQEQENLAPILDHWMSISYDLGVVALSLVFGSVFNHSASDSSNQLAAKAKVWAGDITTTTQQRVKKQIEASLSLNETREQFDARLKSVFVNPYRGAFIAQQEAMDSYINGQVGLAVDQQYGYKIALSSQAKDKVCGDINGEIVPINAAFSNGLMQPTYHFGCLCGLGFCRYADGTS